MSRILRIALTLGALLIALAALGASPAGAQGAPHVRALLFYSPSCPHCQAVLTETMPPLIQTYGDQLQVLAVDVSTEAGSQLYVATMQQYAVPDDQWVVPILVVGDHYLTGSFQIPQEFPGLIEDYLAAGGVDWPDVPGLQEQLAALGVSDAQSQPTQQSTQPGSELVAPLPDPNPALPEETPSTWQNHFVQDPRGGTLSLLVLLGLIATAVWSVNRVRAGNPVPKPWPAWDEILLVLAGLAVAAYLAYVELTLQPAVCGPVGDCNAVQQSEYARLFGVLPVGLLGVLGYLFFGAVWLAEPRVAPKTRPQLTRFAWWAALGGLLFSIYLTFLEPFVIGATCVWCLSSAVLMALITRQATAKHLARGNKSRTHERKRGPTS